MNDEPLALWLARKLLKRGDKMYDDELYMEYPKERDYDSVTGRNTDYDIREDDILEEE